jgi:hypothetical protein
VTAASGVAQYIMRRRANDSHEDSLEKRERLSEASETRAASAQDARWRSEEANIRKIQAEITAREQGHAPGEGAAGLEELRGEVSSRTTALGAEMDRSFGARAELEFATRMIRQGRKELREVEDGVRINAQRAVELKTGEMLLEREGGRQARVGEELRARSEALIALVGILRKREAGGLLAARETGGIPPLPSNPCQVCMDTGHSTYDCQAKCCACTGVGIHGNQCLFQVAPRTIYDARTVDHMADAGKRKKAEDAAEADRKEGDAKSDATLNKAVEEALTTLEAADGGEEDEGQGEAKRPRTGPHAGVASGGL